MIPIMGILGSLAQKEKLHPYQMLKNEEHTEDTQGIRDIQVDRSEGQEVNAAILDLVLMGIRGIQVAAEPQEALAVEAI